MRDLTKSTFSAGLAMSLLGMQQMCGLFRRPRNNGERSSTTGSLDAVTQAMVDQYSDPLRETFRVGDRVQRELIDLTFGFLTLNPFRRQGGSSSFTDAARQTTDRARRWMGNMDISGCSCRGGQTADDNRSTSWAPPPPPPRPRADGGAGEGWGPAGT